MNNFPGQNKTRLVYVFNRSRAKQAVKTVCFLFMLFFLLSGCDVMGGSVLDFIAYNTGGASIDSWTFLSTNRFSRVEGSYIHLPENGFVEILVKIKNPQNYDLAVKAIVYEYIDKDGKKWEPAPPSLLVNTNLLSPQTVDIKIGEMGSNAVSLGDSFRIRLYLAMSDGTRDFGYEDLPQIVYDTQLLPAYNLGIVSESDPPFATWSIQNEDEHKGINMITLEFVAKNSDDRKGPWVYRKDAEGNWLIQSGLYDEDILKYDRLTIMDVDKKIFSLPFPLGSVDLEVFGSNYDFFVTIEDKNEIASKTSLEGISSLFWFDDLQVERRIRTGNGAYRYETEPFFTYLDGVPTYNLVVPYDVDGIRISYTKKFPENQAVIFTPNNVEQAPPVERGISQIGVNNIKMQVEWKDQDTGIALTGIYTFVVLRNTPDRDSTVKDFKVLNSDGLSPFILSPAFTPPSNNVNDHENVQKDYTVFVPYSVNNIAFQMEYLDTSTATSRKTSETGWNANVSSVISGTLSDPSYLGSFASISAAGLSPDPLKNGKWFYNTTDNYRYNYDPDNATTDYPWVNTFFNYSSYDFYFPDYGSISSVNVMQGRSKDYSVFEGENNFEILVSPQNGASRTYHINVIKATEVDNQAARLSNLTVPSSCEITPSFYEGIYSYAVNVPVGTSSIAIQTQVKSGARIVEVSSDKDPGQTVWNESTGIATVSNISPGYQKTLTFKVSGGPLGSLPNDYLVSINGNLAALTDTPTLKGVNNGIDVTWFNSAEYISYDICYNTTGSDPNANPGSATIWCVNIPAGAAGTQTTTTLSTPSNDNVSRYVWLRGKNSNGVVTNWKQAQTTPLSGFGASYFWGIPGTAGLSNINVTVPSGASLSPLFNSGTHDYNLDVPYSVTNVNLGISVSNYNTISVTSDKTGGTVSGTAPNFAYNDPNTLGYGPGNDETYTIFSLSPDKVSRTDDYKITVRRKFRAPQNLVLKGYSNSIVVSWNNDSNVTSSDFYEITYEASGEPKKTIEVAGTAIDATIPGLTPNKSYTVTIRAKRSDGLLGGESTASKYTEDGTFKVTISSPNFPLAEYNFWSVPDITVSWASNVNYPLSVTVPAGYTFVAWYMDDERLSTSSSCTITVRKYSQGVHYISAKIKRTADNYIFSNFIEFTIIP